MGHANCWQGGRHKSGTKKRASHQQPPSRVAERDSRGWYPSVDKGGCGNGYQANEDWRGQVEHGPRETDETHGLSVGTRSGPNTHSF